MDGHVSDQEPIKADAKQYQPQTQHYQPHQQHQQQQHHHHHHLSQAQDPPQMENAFHTQLHPLSLTNAPHGPVAGQLGHRSLDVSALAATLPAAVDPQYLPRRQSHYDVPNPMAFMSPPIHHTSLYSPGHQPLAHPLYLNHSPQQYYGPSFGQPTDHYPHLQRHLSAPLHSQPHLPPLELYAYSLAHPSHPLIHSGIESHHNLFSTAFGVNSAATMQRSSQHHSPSTEQSSAPFSFPRGPPRKPKQSGHALWVGNLPPATTVIELKDHFSFGFTKDIESLFLISKSNCAFVNYRTEEACVAALSKFHDSRFHSVRLVCRLRRGLATSPTMSTTSPTTDHLDSTENSPPLVNGLGSDDDSYSPIIVSGSQPSSATRRSSQSSPVKSGNNGGNNDNDHEKVPEKYYIVKSLTPQDIEASVKNGVWATQSHNEKTLNEAFRIADSVYLIFSANKSGEYYGYARMASAITGDPVSIAPRGAEHAHTPHDGPKIILTPATDHAPAGRVIDDSDRGTIFWEAENPEEEQDGDVASRDHGENGQDRGRQFKIDWISTARIPFYRTRGLRNPWNANREVKIARDGTELEPSVGKRLVQMFHRPPQSPVLHPFPTGPAMYGIN